MIRINLLAERKAGGRSGGGASGTDMMIVLIGVFVLVGCVGFGVWKTWSLKNQRDKWQTDVAALAAEAKSYEPDLKKVKELEAKRNEFKRKVDAIQQLKANQTGPVRLMARLYEVRPPEVQFTQLTHTAANRVNISATAGNLQAITKLYDNLVEAPEFSQVPPIQYVRSGSKYVFSVGFQYTPPGSPVSDEETANT